MLFQSISPFSGVNVLNSADQIHNQPDDVPW